MYIANQLERLFQNVVVSRKKNSEIGVFLGIELRLFFAFFFVCKEFRLDKLKKTRDLIGLKRLVNFEHHQ